MHRIIFEEVRQSLGVGQIVYRYKLEICNTLVLRGAHDLAANSTKSVDAYPCCHSYCSVQLEPVTAGVSPAESHV